MGLAVQVLVKLLLLINCITLLLVRERRRKNFKELQDLAELREKTVILELYSIQTILIMILAIFQIR